MGRPSTISAVLLGCCSSLQITADTSRTPEAHGIAPEPRSVSARGHPSLVPATVDTSRLNDRAMPGAAAGSSTFPHIESRDDERDFAACGNRNEPGPNSRTRW